MAETILNDLSKARLFDILKPLLLEKKTGLLSIKGKENGELFLELGRIVHSRAKQATGEDAFNSIMDWRSGRCSFDPDALPPVRTIPISTEQLLLNWSYRKQEWDKIRTVVPSSNAIFRISLKTNSEDKNIKAEQWKVLVLTNGIRTVAEVANSLAWNQLKTSRVIFQMVQSGLLERGEETQVPGRKCLDETFFQTLENEMKRTMGPVAPIIIDDKLAEFGLSRAAFPRDRAAALIESLCEEIPQEAKQKEFLKTMEEYLLSTG